MGLHDEPRLYENENGVGPVKGGGSEQRIRAAIKSGTGPLSGVIWDAHSKSVLSNVETYEFFKGGLTGTKLATAILTYDDDDLCDLISSVWTYP